MYKSHFNQQEKAQLIAQYQAGATLDELACLWKAAKGTLWNRFKKWGVEMRPSCRRPVKKAGRPPKFTPEQVDEMCKLYLEANKTSDELATIFSTSRTTIDRYLKSRGVVKRTAGRRGREFISKEMITLIASEKVDGMTWKELGKHYGYCSKYLSATCKQAANELAKSLR